MNCICIENNNWVEILAFIVALLSLALSLNAFRLQKISFIDNSINELSKDINSNKGKDLSFLVTNCIIAKQILEIHIKDEFTATLYGKQDIIDKFYLNIHVHWRQRIKDILKERGTFLNDQIVRAQFKDSINFLYSSIKKYDGDVTLLLEQQINKLD